MLSFTRTLRNNKNMLHTVMSLSWPAILEQLLQTLVQYVDTAMVGRIGASASAAVGLTTTSVWLITSPLYAMSIGVIAYIAQAIGAKNFAHVKTAVVQAVWLVVIFGSFMGVVAAVISPHLPQWLGAEKEIQADASMYFLAITIPMIFRSSGIIMSAVLRAAGNTMTPMVVNAVMNVINVILNIILIPVYGVLGSGIATGISFALGGSFMFVSVCRNPLLSPLHTGFKFNWPVMKMCVRVSVPAVGTRLVDCFGQVVYTMLVAKLGTLALASHIIALIAEEAFYVPAGGVQVAASTLSGNSVGEKDMNKFKNVAAMASLVSAAIVGALSILLFLFPVFVMTIFTNVPVVIETGSVLLRIVAVSEPFFAVLMVLEGVFNGAGYTKIPFLFTIISMWGVRITMTFTCVNILHLGLNSVWVCMVTANLVHFTLLLVCMLRGRWITRIFESEE